MTLPLTVTSTPFAFHTAVALAVLAPDVVVPVMSIVAVPWESVRVVPEAGLNEPYTLSVVKLTNALGTTAPFASFTVTVSFPETPEDNVVKVVFVLESVNVILRVDDEVVVEVDPPVVVPPVVVVPAAPPPPHPASKPVSPTIPASNRPLIVLTLYIAVIPIFSSAGWLLCGPTFPFAAILAGARVGSNESIVREAHLPSAQQIILQ